jgi:tRNA uridine 5-carbamoylmethylation protein Kti12
MPTAINQMMNKINAARRAGKDIIWDQTSTTKASRTRKFKALPEYYHIAVVFKPPPMEELIRRLDSRPGKTIPPDVIRGMLESFDMPDESEGFKEIWVV